MRAAWKTGVAVAAVVATMIGTGTTGAGAKAPNPNKPVPQVPTTYTDPPGDVCDFELFTDISRGSTKTRVQGTRTFNSASHGWAVELTNLDPNHPESMLVKAQGSFVVTELPDGTVSMRSTGRNLLFFFSWQVLPAGIEPGIYLTTGNVVVTAPDVTGDPTSVTHTGTFDNLCDDLAT